MKKAAAMKAMKPMKAMKKKVVHRWTRTHGKGYGFEGRTGAHRRWLESQGPHEEQVWQDCQQEEARRKCKKPLDDCLQGSSQGTGRPWILRHWRQDARGQSFVCQSQISRQVSPHIFQSLCRKVLAHN